MKTKKEVLSWYEKRGKITDNDLARNDKKDLLSKWEGSWVESQVGGSTIKVVLSGPKSWKYPVKLFFTENGENFRIVGF